MSDEEERRPFLSRSGSFDEERGDEGGNNPVSSRDDSREGRSSSRVSSLGSLARPRNAEDIPPNYWWSLLALVAAANEGGIGYNAMFTYFTGKGYPDDLATLVSSFMSAGLFLSIASTEGIATAHEFPALLNSISKRMRGQTYDAVVGENTVRKRAAQIVGGVAVLLVLYYEGTILFSSLYENQDFWTKIGGQAFWAHWAGKLFIWAISGIDMISDTALNLGPFYRGVRSLIEASEPKPVLNVDNEEEERVSMTATVLSRVGAIVLTGIGTVGLAARWGSNFGMVLQDLPRYTGFLPWQVDPSVAKIMGQVGIGAGVLVMQGKMGGDVATNLRKFPKRMQAAGSYVIGAVKNICSGETRTPCSLKLTILGASVSLLTVTLATLTAADSLSNGLSNNEGVAQVLNGTMFGGDFNHQPSPDVVADWKFAMSMVLLVTGFLACLFFRGHNIVQEVGGRSYNTLQKLKEPNPHELDEHVGERKCCGLVCS